jgi:hypothetical protein
VTIKGKGQTFLFPDLITNFVPGPTTLGIKVITKLDVARQAPQYLQPLLAFVPKASQLKLQRKYCGAVSH